MKRLVYIDALRVVATVAVITIHVAANNFHTTSVDGFEWQTFNFYDALARWAVPVFVMISGALFLNPDKEISVKKLYTKNIARILCALIVWAIIYTAFDYFTRSITTKQQIVTELVLGKYHLWFLFMIIGLYICVPFIREIARKPNVVKYFLGVAFVFSFVIPTLTTAADALLPIIGNSKLTFIESTLVGAYGKMHFHMTLEFVSYFVLGYYLATTEFKPGTRRAIYALGVLAFLVIVALSSYVSTAGGKANGAFYGNMTLCVLAEAVAVFVLVKQLFSDKSAKAALANQEAEASAGSGVAQDGPSYRALVFVSNRSFGVYLVHILVLDSLTRFCGLTTLSFNPVLSVPVIVMIVFAVALAISSVLHLIPVVNKYVV